MYICTYTPHLVHLDEGQLGCSAQIVGQKKRIVGICAPIAVLTFPLFIASVLFTCFSSSFFWGRVKESDFRYDITE